MVTFDTLTAAKELKKTGLDDRQAEAIVATISKAISEIVARKGDLELQSATTSTNVQAQRAEIKADFRALRSDIKLPAQFIDNRSDAFEKLMVTIENKPL